MIYQLTYIPNHASYEVHEAVAYFINNIETKPRFSLASIFNPDYIWFVTVCDNSPKLVRLLRKLFRNYKAIPVLTDRQRIVNSFNYWNDVDARCRLIDPLTPLWDDLPNPIKTTLYELFDYLYNQLTKSSNSLRLQGRLREDHYNSYWEYNGEICKICGIRELDPPGVQNNAYDHYLHFDKYPFVGINYKNIIPICDKCNEAPAKGQKHILYSNYQTRTTRTADYPYETGVTKTVETLVSSIFDSSPVITINYSGDTINKITTWKEVFNIDIRYKEAIKIKRKRWVKNLVLNNKTTIIATSNDLKSEIEDYIGSIADNLIECYQHLESAFWENIKSNHAELDLLLEHINEQRINGYGAV
jgi:hypothetical protein